MRINFCHKTIQKIGLISVFIGILILILRIYWIQEVQYLLPTPIPEKYQTVKLFETINTADQKIPQTAFIHFFNSECPCSRFNLKHFNFLVKKYHAQIRFYAVVENAENKRDLEKVRDQINENAILLIDSDKNLAKKCGVFSSPQAVILSNGKLYFRGNYNQTRYCTNKNTNFAQMALEALLVGKDSIFFDKRATEAYGCPIPNLTY